MNDTQVNRGAIVKGTWMIAAVLVAACSTVRGQELPPQVTSPAGQAMPPIAPDVPPAAEPQALSTQTTDSAPRPAAQLPDRRETIKTLETVLTLAVKSGAAKLAQQMRASEPGSLFVVDTGRTRGFDLQGYGVFFDVDVPMMKQSVVWSTRELTAQDRRLQLENYIQTQPPGAARDFAMRELQRVRQGMRQTTLPVDPLVAVTNSQTPPGVVTAATTDVSAVANTPAAPPSPIEMADPNELYTEAVKSSLIDAMLNHSLGLKLGADDWLTVAARDAQGPLTGVPDEASTIVIRIKGGDLAAFHAGKLTREEVLKKVEVKEL
jgi:hypothetical protein